MWRAVGCNSLVHSPLFLAVIIWGKEGGKEQVIFRPELPTPHLQLVGPLVIGI